MAKSLDHKSFYFKHADKAMMTPSSLVAELRAAAEADVAAVAGGAGAAADAARDATAAGLPHLTLAFTSAAACACDAEALIEFACERLGLEAGVAAGVALLWRALLRDFLCVPPRARAPGAGAALATAGGGAVEGDAPLPPARAAPGTRRVLFASTRLCVFARRYAFPVYGPPSRHMRYPRAQVRLRAPLPRALRASRARARPVPRAGHGGGGGGDRGGRRRPRGAGPWWWCGGGGRRRRRRGPVRRARYAFLVLARPLDICVSPCAGTRGY